MGCCCSKSKKINNLNKTDKIKVKLNNSNANNNKSSNKCCSKSVDVKESHIIQVKSIQTVKSNPTPRTPKTANKAATEPMVLSKRLVAKFVIGNITKFEDLEYSKEIRRPGWMLESTGIVSYNILMEENLGMKVVRRFMTYPFLAHLPEACNGTVLRAEFKGYQVVVFKITEPNSNNQIIIDRCVRKLRSGGAPEFDDLMTFYGADFHLVFTNWPTEEKALRAQSNCGGFY